MSADIFVAGSAHLDVLGQVTGDDTAIDRIGEVSIEIGGTACNIATNLADLGLRPRLMTAMQPRSPYTDIIKAHLQSHGVEVLAVHHEGMPAAIFSAHIDSNGEMLSAVSCMPLDHAHFDDAEIAHAMEGVRCAVLDCNLSAQSLAQFARIARSLRLPVFAAAVSEEKSLRLAGMKGLCSAVFMNRREAAYLGRRLAATSAPLAIASRLACSLVISKGEDGAVVVDEDVQTQIPLGFEPSIGQTLGAGDAMLAAAIKHRIFDGMSLTEAVRGAFAFAGGIVGRSNCNTGPRQAIETALNLLGDQARSDALTGLANRRAGEIALDQIDKAGSAYSVLMLDIDHFKAINDRFGHDIGDDVIRRVARVMSSVVRESDLACRWGGEEFLCILPNLSCDQASLVAERVRADVEAITINLLTGCVVTVTVSIGVACFPGDGGIKEVLRMADEALYRAKQGGRNRVERENNASP